MPNSRTYFARFQQTMEIVGGNAVTSVSFPWQRVRSARQTLRVDHKDPGAASILAVRVRELLRGLGGDPSQAVVVCVGTDRATGDSLGPLVGSRLVTCRPGLQVYGTLEKPVHAANLGSIVPVLRECRAKGKPIVAVDACLGRREAVGTIAVKPGPLSPGTGVRKELPKLGDLHMVGVVNTGGFMEYFVLQSTRLALVVRMAEVIAAALIAALASSPRTGALEPPSSPVGTGLYQSQAADGEPAVTR